MAFITLNKKKLQHNFNFLDKLFKEKNIEWGIVSKILCGNKKFIQELLDLGVKEIHDSRISNLKVVKELDSSIQTVYIKPPPKRSIKAIVHYADVSLNTEIDTIRLLSVEAKKANKIHKVIIMIEMGDLREGVMGVDLLEFYGEIFNLPNIEVVGIGTNLNCLYGVMPSQDKLIQLSLYEQLIEAKFDRKIPYVSGGTSVTIPLLIKNLRPTGVNHFRVGEALYFGNDLFTNKTIVGMKDDVFKLQAEIIELTEKPVSPSGEFGENPSGDIFENPGEKDLGKTSLRAILDVGLLDVSPEYLIPDNKDLRIDEASSDMLIVDCGKSKKKYKVGDLMNFKLKYMGALRLFSSDYIEKKIV